MWHVLHVFGTLSKVVDDGGMNLNVWLRTFTLAMVCSIFGMWQSTHCTLPTLWCVCSSVLPAGPAGEFGP